MCCTLESTLSNEELFLEQAKIYCFRGRPHIAEVRKKNGGGRGKSANKFTPCSITTFLYMFYLFLPLRPREAGYQKTGLIFLENIRSPIVW